MQELNHKNKNITKQEKTQRLGYSSSRKYLFIVLLKPFPSHYSTLSLEEKPEANMPGGCRHTTPDITFLHIDLYRITSVHRLTMKYSR